jgi:hypothetical protein
MVGSVIPFWLSGFRRSFVPFHFVDNFLGFAFHVLYSACGGFGIFVHDGPRFLRTSAEGLPMNADCIPVADEAKPDEVRA